MTAEDAPGLPGVSGAVPVLARSARAGGRVERGPLIRFPSFKILKSVKFRLTLWYALILTVILSIFSILMYSEFSRVLYRDVDRTLFYETHTLEESLMPYVEKAFRTKVTEESLRPFPEASSFVLSPKLRARLLKTLREWERNNHYVNRSTLLIRFFGFDKEVLLGNLKGWQQDILFPEHERDAVFMEKGASFQTIHFRRRPIRLYYYLVQYKMQPLFVIQSAVPIYELKRTLQRLAFIIWVSIPGAVLAACVAGWFLAKRSFRPVDLMIREAKQITAAYLKGRLPRTHAEDELDRLAETLNEMIDRLEASTRVVQEFSSNVSHELKTPLAIIRGEIDLALRRSRSPEALVETLRVIESEVNELIRLVDDLMFLVRSDARQLRFEKKQVSLRELLEQVTHLYQERALAKKIQMTLSSPKDLQILGDPVYLKRLFSNLVDNAIKFTQEGGQVAVHLDVKPREAAIKVTDNGMGIEADMIEKVFLRFYRTDQARSHEGAGLGLNIAKAICEAHQGTLGIESQPGKGTIVTIRLPTA